MTTLPKVNKEDLKADKLYAYMDDYRDLLGYYADPAFLLSGPKTYDVCDLNGQFYGPIELEE